MVVKRKLPKPDSVRQLSKSSIPLVIQNLSDGSNSIAGDECITDIPIRRTPEVDAAEDGTNYARYNILVQSGTAMLAQANQSLRDVLKLLQ